MGLLNAYAYDKSGGNPRIVLDELVISDAMGEALDPLIVTDHADTMPMLHTFWDFANFDSSTLMPSTIKVAALKISQHLTRTCGDETKPDHVLGKWHWMRLYWNRAVGTGGLPIA
jgi:hypothetical protein